MAAEQTSDLIDSRVSAKQCQRALDALLKHARASEKKREENELLPGKEQHVWLVLAVKQMYPEKKLKPFKMCPIVHPLVDPRTSPICLITKDPQREYKDLIASQNIKFISRVVGVEKLKGKFKPFEARRMLLQENGLFLADQRIIPILPKLLGKRWFEAKKQPIPVNLTRKDLKGELERAISSTYMHQNQGTCTSIKIGTLSQTPAQILTNLKSALPAIVKHVPGGWDNMQSFQVKTNSSMSLPVWNCNLEDAAGGRWQGLVAGDDSDSEAPSGLDGEGNAGQDGISSEEDSGASPPLSPPPVAPSKKRSAEVDDKPAKKAKSLKDERATTTPKPPKPSKVSALTPKPPTSSIRSTKAVNPADQGSEVVRERKKKTVTAISPSAQAAPIGIVEVEETITLSPKATRSGTKATKRGGSAPGLDVARAVPVRGLAEAGSAAGKNKRAKSSAAVTADDAPTTTASDLLGAKAMRKGKADKGPARESSGPAGTTLASKTTTPRAEVAETTGPLITTLPQSTTPASYSITQDEMKIKRSNASGERKKEKVVKSKPGKSIKDSFLKRK